MSENKHLLANENSFYEHHFLFKSKTWHNIFVVGINSLLIIGLIAFNLYRQIDANKNYIDSNLKLVKSSMMTLAYRNDRYAQTVTKTLKDVSIMSQPGLVSINTYPSMNEFGFNRGIYPDNLLNGSLIGVGKPSEAIYHDTNLFQILDDLWAEQHRRNITYNYYYISHQHRYFYLSSKYSLNDFNMTKDFFTTDFYSQQRSDLQQESTLKKGFYFTPPYRDFFTHDMVITIKSPVFSAKDIIIGDVGVDIPVKSLMRAITLPNDFKQYLNIYLYDDIKKQTITLYDGKRSYLPWINMNRQINDTLSIHAEISSWYILYSSIQDISLIIVLIIALNYMYSLLKMHKVQKNEYKIEAYTDSLTGLYNRRIIKSSVMPLLQEAKDTHSPVSFIIIDANDFKIINDNYGHDVGDMALKHIANQIFALSRSSDICIRLGGDEFCIVLPNTTIGQAHSLSRRLELAVYGIKFYSQKITTTITTSCVQYDGEETLEETFARADKILYNNKLHKKERLKKLKEQLL
ncbi:TPA: sensor domain-containing diguanylate cyclase [Photobacterium damselae]|uniref:sensor domain-containing diguanylate cyclase n=2 Tax=Photobacterium damselae TaxID=38293 RepID=UPI00130215C0|nr:sensor domain-containing diguanylate cyclase [Photobacterium damselae]